MTKQGSVVLSLALLGLIVIVVVVVLTRIKPPAKSRTTLSAPPPKHAATRPRVLAPERSRPSLSDDHGDYVDDTGAMGKAAGHLAPPPPAPGTTRRRHLPRATLVDIRGKLHTVIARCVADATPTWNTAPKRSHVVLNVAVHSGQLFVRSARASLSATDDAGAAACIQKGAAQLRISVKGAGDLDSHTIRLTLGVRG